ncbi:(3R)-hydroxymyristoyl-ACP dehydratase [compost metagenome]|jgi:predicted hotdog family 3-hydroxylacyl-ACP dehydratase
METMLLEKEMVENLLPQKFPFVMVDAMHSYSETSLVSGLEIQRENIFVSNDIFLEAGLIEHMAQSVALHTGYQYFLKNEIAPTGYIGSIKEIEIKKLPKLSDNIQTEVTILQEFAGITLVDIVTTLNNEEIARGQMKTVLAK